MFSSMNANQTPISRDHNKKLVKIIQTLLSYEQSNIFRKPIPHKSLGWDDYKDLVKKPTDLNFVRRQYNEGKYKMVEEFLDQIQTVWDNVFLYNKREHETFDLAVRMQKYFDDLLNDLLPEYHEKINRTIYFKQFQKNKPQKKPSNSQNNYHAEKILSKVQKMDLQGDRQEIQAQRQPQTNKRKEPNNSRKQKIIPNSTLVTPIVPQSKQSIQQYIANEQKPVQTTVNKTNLIEPEPQVQPINNIPVSNPPNPTSIQIQNPYENQSDQQGQLPPILVNLKQTPTFQQTQQITNSMKVLFQMQELQTLSKVVKILTKHEKQNMVIDGQDISFRIGQIHISSYVRIKRQLDIKLNQIEQIQKFKEANGGINGKYTSRINHLLSQNQTEQPKHSN